MPNPKNSMPPDARLEHSSYLFIYKYLLLYHAKKIKRQARKRTAQELKQYQFIQAMHDRHFIRTGNSKTLISKIINDSLFTLLQFEKSLQEILHYIKQYELDATEKEKRLRDLIKNVIDLKNQFMLKLQYEYDEFIKKNTRHCKMI